jgi:two-component sensor histidine kinase
MSDELKPFSYLEQLVKMSTGKNADRASQELARLQAIEMTARALVESYKDTGWDSVPVIDALAAALNGDSDATR